MSADLKCTINRNYLRAHFSSTLFAAVEIIPQNAQKQARHKTNVALAIDCSSSMSGDKFTKVKESSINLIRSLSPNDLVSVISFSDRAQVLSSSSEASNKDELVDIISRLQMGVSTDMYEGLELSFKEIERNAGNDLISRIILLTDGHPTVGKIADRDFANLTEKIRGKDITITTIGIGEDYNEKLLRRIAENGGGIWYHVVDPDMLSSMLNTELSEMSHTVLVNPLLRLVSGPGSIIKDVYTIYPRLNKAFENKNDSQLVQIRLNDLINRHPQYLVFRIRVPERIEGRFRIARVELGDMEANLLVDYTEVNSLYEEETNSYPRILFFSAEAVYRLQKGFSMQDGTQIQEVDTMVKALNNDPKLDTVIRNHKIVETVSNTLTNMLSKAKRGNVTPKEFSNATTFIGNNSRRAD